MNKGVVCTQSVGFYMRLCGRISERAGLRCYVLCIYGVVSCLARCVGREECAWVSGLFLVDASTREGWTVGVFS